MKSKHPAGWKTAQHSRVVLSVLTSGLLLLAASCSTSPAPEPTAPPPVSPIPSATPTEIFTPATTQTTTLTPVPTDHSSLITESLDTDPQITEICSPLAVQPLEKIVEIITQPFIMPRVMEDGSYKDDGHHGLDLGYYTRDGLPFTGTPVLAALEGVIAAVVLDSPPYGGMILVETPYNKIPPQLIQNRTIPEGNSLYVLYAHLQNLSPFNLQQSVTCGQPLAETGLTGFTGGPHLHFEARWGQAGASFPEGMAYYRADTTEAERANYRRWRMSGEFQLFDPLELLTIQP